MIALPLALALALSVSAAPKPAAVNPNKKTQLTVEVKPATAVVFIDGKKKGTGSRSHVVVLEPGRHVIKVVNKGDEHQEQVVLKKGEQKSWSWAFEDDRRDVRAPAPEGSEAPQAEPAPEAASEKKAGSNSDQFQDDDLPK